MTWKEIYAKTMEYLKSNRSKNTVSSYESAFKSFGFTEKPSLDSLVKATTRFHEEKMTNKSILLKYSALRFVLTNFEDEFDSKEDALNALVVYSNIRNSNTIPHFENVKEAKDVDDTIWTVAANYAFDKNFKLGAMYLNGDQDNYKGDDDGFVVTASYKGAKAAKAGSWGLYANYFNQPQATFVKHTITGYTDLPVWGVATDEDEIENVADGFKGFEVGANYTLAKNIVAGVKYYDLEAREGEADVKTLWSEVIFTF